MITYIRNHWHGRHALKHAFWINLVLVRTVVILLEEGIQPAIIAPTDEATTVYIVYALTLHGLLFAWQLVGTVRALDNFQREGGVIGWVWATHLSILLAIVFTVVRIFVSVEILLRPAEPAHVTWERARSSKYDIAVVNDGTRLSITGEVELGMAKALRRLLAEHTAIKSVSLESPGGHIYAGRAVAQLIAEFDLNTYVGGTCSSACVTAFLGGRQRILGPDGRIGFHQYGNAAWNPTPFSDLKAEQAKDRAYYAEQGVDPTFLERVYTAPHNDIWYPTHAELLAAGVVHRVEH